jgi:hypothetical protein
MYGSTTLALPVFRNWRLEKGFIAVREVATLRLLPDWQFVTRELSRWVFVCFVKDYYSRVGETDTGPRAVHVPFCNA